MIELIFCHGWGYDNSIFANLANYYSPKYSIVNLDLGFFSPYQSNNAINPNSKYKILISHSYGLMHARLNYHQLINTYIAINPVLDFSNYNNYLKAMIRNIKTGKVRHTLTQFYQLCQDKEPIFSNYTNDNKLILALENMQNFDKQLWQHSVYMHFLHGINDIFYYFADNISSLKTNISIQGGHLLPKTNFLQVINFINSILFDINKELLQNKNNSYS